MLNQQQIAINAEDINLMDQKKVVGAEQNSAGMANNQKRRASKPGHGQENAAASGYGNEYD